ARSLHDALPILAGHPDGLGRLDVVLFDDLACGLTYHPGHTGHVGNGDDHHDQPHARADDRHHQQRGDELGEGQQDVVGAHQDVVDPPTAVAGDDTDHGPGHPTDTGRGSGQQQEGPATPQEAGQDVTATVVAAENGAVHTRFIWLGDEFGGGVRGDERAEDRHQYDQYGQGHADLGTAEAPRGAKQPTTATSGRVRSGRGLTHRFATLTFGLAASPITSATRLTTMYTPAMSSTDAWINGTS